MNRSESPSGQDGPLPVGILTASQQVKEVAKPGGLALECLGITALAARNGDEFLVLHVEETGILAGCADLLGLILGVVALGAGKIGSNLGHGQSSREIYAFNS